MYFFEMSPKILGIRSNKKLTISFGLKKTQIKKWKINLNFFVVNDIKIPQGLKKFYWFYGRENKIFYKQPLFFKKYLKMTFEPKTTSSYTIIINNFYWKFRKIKVNSGCFLSPIQRLENLINVCLLKNYLSLIYGACVAKNKKGILFLGPPSVGKTTVVLKFLENGYEFLGDDVVISDGKTIYSCPYTKGVLEKTYKNILLSKLKNIFPAHKIIDEGAKSILEVLGEKNVKTRNECKVDKVFLLERNLKNDIAKIGVQESLKILNVLNKANFLWDSDRLILGFSFFSNFFNLNKLTEAYLNILRKIAERKIYVVKASNTENFYKIINENI